MSSLQFLNFSHLQIYKYFIQKLSKNYTPSIQVNILPEYILEQDQFLESIKKLVQGDVAHDPIQPGEIYALPIRTKNHLIASILFKDFNGKLFYIFNNSNGKNTKIKYKTLDPKNNLKDLNINIIDLSLRTQFHTDECQIIAISTMQIILEQIAQILSNQRKGEEFNLNIDNLKNTLSNIFKKSLLSDPENDPLEEAAMFEESEQNKKTIVDKLELDNNLQLILYRDNFEAFRHELLDMVVEQINYILKTQANHKKKKAIEILDENQFYLILDIKDKIIQIKTLLKHLSNKEINAIVHQAMLNIENNPNNLASNKIITDFINNYVPNKSGKVKISKLMTEVQNLTQENFNKLINKARIELVEELKKIKDEQKNKKLQKLEKANQEIKEENQEIKEKNQEIKAITKNQGERFTQWINKILKKIWKPCTTNLDHLDQHPIFIEKAHNDINKVALEGKTEDSSSQAPPDTFYFSN